MELGTKIRDMRLQLNLTQEELADRCELTKGYISQLENDLTSPSIATLGDILSALGSSFAEFFKEERDEKVIFTENDYIEKESDGFLQNWLIPNAQKNLMEPIMVELAPGACTGEDLPHGGEEFGYVLQGKITLTCGKKNYICRKGESFYFSADRTHRIHNESDGKAVVLWISSPPSF